ncbi:hypothetical protein [Embleya sp. NPDC059237]|uniref:hypothetical protein n=1 Tax=Embleya sp. NPDC059237 TaxID=3346784 RepID=UPI00369AE3EF
MTEPVRFDPFVRRQPDPTSPLFCATCGIEDFPHTHLAKSEPQQADETSAAPLDLDAIRARCDAATPGPWGYIDRFGLIAADPEAINADHTAYSTAIACMEPGDDDTEAEEESEARVAANAAFITTARSDVPALLALVAEQAATIAATDAERDRLEAEARRVATARRLEEAAHRQTVAERDDAEHRVALAQRLARRDDYDLDVDLEGIVGDGLCGAADWDGDDRPPQWLVDRVVEIVRPHLARATERAERRGLAWESARRRAVQLRAGLTDARSAINEANVGTLRAGAVVNEARAARQRRDADLLEARAEIARLRTTAVAIGPGLGALAADLAGRTAAEIQRRDDAEADPGRCMPSRNDWRLARDRTRAAEHEAERLEAELVHLRAANGSNRRINAELEAELVEARAEIERLRADRVRERHERAEAAEWPDDEPTAPEVVTVSLDAAGPPPYPTTEDYRVVARGRPAPVDSTVNTLAEAERQMATWRRRRPDSPPLEIRRRQQVWSVAAIEDRDATGAPESPADTPSKGPAPAPDRS